jgi:hypothetical protein
MALGAGREMAIEPGRFGRIQGTIETLGGAVACPRVGV